MRPLAESDLSAVMRMDDRISGAHRHGPLRWAFEDAPRYAWIGVGEAGVASAFRRKDGADIDTAGYCLGRGGRLFDHIGPIVADSTESAAALASAAIGESGGCSLVIDAHDAHEEFGAWLRHAGFEPQRPLYRMCRPGRSPAPSRPPGLLIEFAIMGPEFS